MSGDGSEGDDDFSLTLAQQPVPVHIVLMHGDLTILVSRLTYLFFYLVILWIEKMEGKQVIKVDEEGCPCAP